MTGVQTCALPIYLRRRDGRRPDVGSGDRGGGDVTSRDRGGGHVGPGDRGGSDLRVGDRAAGDIARRGLEIPIAADAAAREVGLPAVRPAVALWETLLRFGRRVAHHPVDSQTAEPLIEWLPATLRFSARDVLVSGFRLAQEAVGTKLLAQDSTWATWAGLGPPAV